MQKKQQQELPDSQSIMATILASIPKEAGVTKIDYEGPRIALYTKTPRFLMENNTIISITDDSGNVIAWSSAGAKGFKGSRKSTPYAAQIAADAAATKAQEHGLKILTVKLKGPGAGRETALRALQSRGFKILSIKDVTPMAHNGSRPPKKRRV